jgi:hypothetical protein
MDIALLLRKHRLVRAWEIMPILFNSLLLENGLAPKDVRLLRHAESGSRKGRTSFELWRDDRVSFDQYQSIQAASMRAHFDADFWASFGATIEGATLFLGIYRVRPLGLLETDSPNLVTGGIDKGGKCHRYEVTLSEHPMNDCLGRLYIDWGAGTRAWVQRADKPVVELRKKLEDPDFPGFNEFIQPLSRIESLPKGWKDALRSSRGIYLLTCPRTKEQYVGVAAGNDGFLGRWLEYVSNSHGGNVELKSREPSDYQLSILEVAGSMATQEELLGMESRWKNKLQSREMGLNAN